MKTRNTPACILAAVATFAAVAPVASRAETPDEWRYSTTIYVWLPDMGGSSAYPVGSGGSSVEVTAGDILNALNFAFMGTLSAQKGRWGIFTDVNYLDLSDSAKRSRDLTVGGIDLPVGVTANVDLGITGWLWTTVGSYRVVDKPDYVMDVIAGARLLNLAEDLEWRLTGNLGDPPIVAQSGKSDVSDNVWDGIVGVKGRATFGAEKNWFVPYYVDIGTGNSDLTWLGMLGVGYSFEWGDVLGVWRYVDYEFSSSDQVQDLYFNGPAFGVTFRF